MTAAENGNWYMVTHDGAATLCVDEADAQEEAKKADRGKWPRNGPHRAVQLVEAGFTAADMASASAQGFRDGVASLAASAGSEPVYQARYQKGFWQDSSRERCEYLQNPENTCAEDWETRILYTRPPTSAEGWSMGERSNPNNCATCRHKQNPDGGHCYMFRFEPAEIEHVAGDVSKNGAEANTSTQQPAPAGATAEHDEWDGTLPESLQRSLNALRFELPTAVVNGVEHEVRSTFKAMHISLTTAKRMYGAACDRLEALEAAQPLPDPFATPQPSPTAQAVSSAVLKAIREANMQLVRTGDNAFMLVPYKVATAQAAESVPAVSDLPPLPDPDLRDVGTKPQDVKDFLNGYATEYARLALAARAPADSVLEDAARYRYLRDGDWREHEKLESVIRLQLNALWDETIDAARKQGGA